MSELDQLQKDLDDVRSGDFPLDQFESLSGVADGIQAEIVAHRADSSKTVSSVAGIRQAIFWLKTAVGLARLHRTVMKQAAILQRSLREVEERQLREDLDRVEQMVSESQSLIESLIREAALSTNRPTPDDEPTSGLRM